MVGAIFFVTQGFYVSQWSQSHLMDMSPSFVHRGIDRTQAVSFYPGVRFIQQALHERRNLLCAGPDGSVLGSSIGGVKFQFETRCGQESDCGAANWHWHLQGLRRLQAAVSTAWNGKFVPANGLHFSTSCEWFGEPWVRLELLRDDNENVGIDYLSSMVVQHRLGGRPGHQDLRFSRWMPRRKRFKLAWCLGLASCWDFSNAVSRMKTLHCLHQNLG